MRWAAAVLAMCCGAAAGVAAAPATGGEDGASLFPRSQVRLREGPFQRAEERNLAYLRALDVDRLLAPYREEAGLGARAPRYPNWESSGLDGHTAGHYLTALAQAWASTGDAEMKRRLDAMVAGLAACQRAHGDGYVGGIPGGRKLWAEVGAGTLRAHGFGINDKWVPWYNLHKLFAGLRDAHTVGGSAEAREVLLGLTGWCEALTGKLSDAQMQEMLRAEHGGMSEVLADVFALTRAPSHLALARRFLHQAFLEPLRRQQDALDGLHANTQIPKAVGCARVAELGGEPADWEAARFFWRTVVQRRTVAIGGNSVREHFNPAGDFSSMVESREGPETCNTYNMLRLTEQLFRREPAAAYADFYERALFNHILSSQHPGHGGFVYFTPLRPRHYRVYSQPSQTFWCCVGSGMENHSGHGRFVYARGDGQLFVNLFVASTLEWPERGLRLRQETAFPDEPRTRLTLALARPQRLTLRVRHPGWVAPGAFRLRVNGRPWRSASQPSSYAAITREWRDGDRVEVETPMRTTVERLPDGSDHVALLHGPIVLAARTGAEHVDGLVAGDGRMAHVSPGPYLPLDAAPMLVGAPEALPGRVRPVPGRPLTFKAPEVLRPDGARGLELEPFFRVHDSRYVVYWRLVPPGEYARVAAGLAARERSRLALEARTLDRVTPGEPQPEVEHNLRSDGSATGVNQGRTWRDASGWFSYELSTRGARRPLELLVTYYAAERERRFDILVGDRPVAEVALDGRQHDRFVDIAYAVPADAAAPNGVLTVRFAARPGSRAGAVYDLRLLAAED